LRNRDEGPAFVEKHRQEMAMPSVTDESAPRETAKLGPAYYVVLIALLAVSGLFLGFAIPTFLGILAAA
jgi:hypothetical protein